MSFKPLHIPLEELRKILDYDKDTGVFTRKQSSHRNYVGKRAGTLHHTGYRFIRLSGKVYAEHRLAWLYVHGEILGDVIDHIDGNKSNNKISNLRCATRSDNNCNALRRKDNSSGIKGINWHKVTNKWMCRVQHDGDRVILGYFNSIEEANEVLIEYRETVHGEFTNHGDKYEQL